MKSFVTLGSSGDDVKQLQKLLNDSNVGVKLVVDGKFGKDTDAAVKRFQATRNIGIDGVVGPKTWAALTARVVTVNLVSQQAPSDSAPWMKHAKAEVNQAEIPGNKHNPRIVAYHATTTLKATGDETPWCSSFVNWALAQTKIKGTNSAAANSWLQWGKAGGPGYGAITVIYNAKAAGSSLSSSGNHVGFLVEETASHFVLLGGNQADKVQISFFPKRSWILRGYRWPAS